MRLLYRARGAAAARQELVARIDNGREIFPYQLALADFDFAEGHFADAERLLRNLASHPDSAEQSLAARVKLAEMYVKNNMIDAAETIVTDIFRKDSHSVEGLKVRASVRIARGQPDLAITDLTEALNDQPRSTELMLLLALAYERSGSMRLAEKQYADALRYSNFNPIVGLDYVGFLQRRGNTELAEQVLTDLSSRSPKDLNVLSALAQVDLARKNWAGARAVAEAIRKAGNIHGLADQVLGAALIGERKFDEGIDVLRKAADTSPSDVRPMVSLVTALLRAERPEKALAFLNSTLEGQPDNAEARVLKGSIQLATGKPDEARKSFKLAIEKQPTNVVGYQALANLYIGERKFDEAVKIIQSGLEMQPDSVILRLAMASALEQDGQYEAAISEYEHLLSTQPGSMIITNNLASLLADHRNDKASLEKAKFLAASLQDSQVPQFKDTLGWISYRRGDYVNAVLLLEKAEAALPNMASVHYHLAMSYVALKQAAKASEQLTAALSLAPDHELEKKIKEAQKDLLTFTDPRHD